MTIKLCGKYKIMFKFLLCYDDLINWKLTGNLIVCYLSNIEKEQIFNLTDLFN